MLDLMWYQHLADAALADEPLDHATALQLLTDPAVELLSLVHAAYRVRLARCGRSVQVHILNNAQNGNCPEDCGYCAQARTSSEDIDTYPIKSEDEVIAEAKRAYDAGAHRYCMVFAGRGPNRQRAQQLAHLVRKVKQSVPIEVCVSAGLMDREKTDLLAAAGLDRLNHNLNTSRERYPDICSTHTYDDRVHTLAAARASGIGLCSGMIVGMGESPEEIVELAQTFASLNVQSIPVNFLLPFEGNRVNRPQNITPDLGLRVLCLMRLTNPRAEVRVAAGREFHFRSMEVLTLYPANSLFLNGYLNSAGSEARATLRMIQDAGFTLQSDIDLSDLLHEPPNLVTLNVKKSLHELRPTSH